MSKTPDGKGVDDKGDGGIEGEKPMGVWDCGSPLYDAYELVTLSHVIERHLMALPAIGVSRRSLREPEGGASALSPSLLPVRRKSRRASSVLAGWAEFVRRRLWKKKVIHEGKISIKKMKSGISNLVSRISPWRK